MTQRRTEATEAKWPVHMTSNNQADPEETIKGESGTSREQVAPLSTHMQPEQRRPGRRQSQAHRDRTVVLAMGTAIPVVAIGLWALAAWLHIGSPLLVTSPWATWQFLVDSASSGELGTSLVATVKATLIAFALAAISGVPAGLALGFLPRTERAFDPYINMLMAMPRIALAPVFILIFGITMEAKIALAWSLSFFMVLISARAGVKSLDLEYLRLVTVLGARRRQIFAKLFLPAAVPSIFAGMRLGLVYSLLGVVGSELIASRVGIGQLITLYSTRFRLEAVYGLLIVLALVASIINAIMAAIEKWLLRWQPPPSTKRGG